MAGDCSFTAVVWFPTTMAGSGVEDGFSGA